MSIKSYALLMCGALLAGCGGEESASSSEGTKTPGMVAVVTDEVEETEAAPTPPPPPVAALPGGMVAVSAPAPTKPVELRIPADSPAQIETDLQDLNSAVDQFIADQKRAPTVKGLLMNGYIEKLPTPPSGKQYILDKSQNRFVLKDA